ncbi:MAG: HAMP domain-containing protein, partial [Brevundimonas sp.]
MKLPSLFRRTPFRLTLMFVALFAAAASAVLAYVYVASASEAHARAEADVRREVGVLSAVYRERGLNPLNQALVERILRGGPYLYILLDDQGEPVTRSLNITPVEPSPDDPPERWEAFRFTDTDEAGRIIRRKALGVMVRLQGGELLFVAQDIGDTEAYLDRLTQALWGAMLLVVVLGLGGGLLISRNLERSMGRFNTVVAAVKGGDLKARAEVRGSGDELDELGAGLNGML